MNDHHLNPTISTDQFTCQHCGREHQSLRALRIHEARHRRDDAKEPPPTLAYACPWCNVTTDHGRGLSQHAKKIHGKDAPELYSARFPECRTACVDCNITVPLTDQEKGYPERCPACSRKHAYATKHHTAWNKGLTKANDPRIATSASNMRKRYAEHGHHNAGKTKENDEGVRAKALKIATALNEHYACNDGWSLGLSKETSDIIKLRSEKTRKTWLNKTYVLKDATLELMRKKKLLSSEIIVARLQNINIELQQSYVDTMTVHKLRCTKCATEFERKLTSIFNNNARCPSCFPPWANKTSRWQQEVADFVASCVSDVEINNRSVIAPLELDVYVPSRKLAIECNGLYWHSEKAEQFDKNHAEHKRLAARRAGVSLFTLFEDEWRDKQQIVRSMIRHRLGLSTKVAARKLTLEHVAPQRIAEFISSRHLDGHVRAQFGLRLVNQSGETMGACSLRWAKNGSDKTTLEIARMCFELETHVQGGSSKFINAAIGLARANGAKTLMSYSDNRLGGLGGYSNYGMVLNGTTVVRFWWTDFSERYDRFQYRADSSRGLTERQVAQEAGVHRIYGCSNSRWTIDL